MTEIDRINDKFFKDTLQKIENARTFLKTVLPEELKKRIDFSCIEIGPTNYISKKFKEYFSDIIIKTQLISKQGKKLPADVCFILEHKTEEKKTIFIQFLKYMVAEWQKDIDNNNTLRVIIPVVFYHGKNTWRIPHSFVDLFDVDDVAKKYLLNFKYIIFDTNQWDFQEERNEELKNNVFLFTAMALMKSTYTDDLETIEHMFKFWWEKGFTKNIEYVIYFLTYIYETQNLDSNQLKKMLEKSNLDGGDIMATLAQRLREEGKKIGIEEGIKTGMKAGMEKGMKTGIKTAKLETAKELLKNDIDIKIIAKATGLSLEEIKKLSSANH